PSALSPNQAIKIRKRRELPRRGRPWRTMPVHTQSRVYFSKGRAHLDQGLGAHQSCARVSAAGLRDVFLETLTSVRVYAARCSGQRERATMTIGTNTCRRNS